MSWNFIIVQMCVNFKHFLFLFFDLEFCLFNVTIFFFLVQKAWKVVIINSKASTFYFCRVGIELPTIEVRFENLSIEAKCHVGGRALPTLYNVFRNNCGVECSNHPHLTLPHLLLYLHSNNRLNSIYYIIFHHHTKINEKN